MAVFDCLWTSSARPTNEGMIVDTSGSTSSCFVKRTVQRHHLEGNVVEYETARWGTPVLPE